MKKKIRNIRQLKKDQKRLQQRERELLSKISSDWQDLKENLRPQNILKERVKKCWEENPRTTKEDSMVKSMLAFGASLLVKKLAKRTEDTLDKIFN